MATNYKAQGQVLQYTCGVSESVSSGEVVFIGGIPGIAIHDIGNSESGSVQIGGVWEVEKEDDSTNGPAFALGAPVYWDAAEEEAVLAAGNPLLGYAYEAAGKTDGTVKVLLAGDPENMPVQFKAGDTITGGKKLVYISGYDADEDVLEMTLAGSDTDHAAMFYVPEVVDDGDIGTAYRTYHQTGIDTDTDFSAVGDLVYLGEGGAFAAAGTTTNNEINQVVGVVTAYSATVGAILFFPGESKAKAHSAN